MAKIKVFKMNDYDWWAGENFEEVKKAYLSENDFDESSVDDGHKLTASEMKRFKFHYEPDRDPKRYRSFKRQLEIMIHDGYTFPCFFASTEY